ncbi:hypothetical protein EZV62_008036 [Acer yangbiense]|uniref:Neprosin PEP catalytic domain-containing protein n=1 Tax=Acer yangbiense TaxID=1000413 RepID=A0A5C7IC85_9ROSI|nr:hypothetical protein EZV62_008036 [Acer yangbiense]
MNQISMSQIWIENGPPAELNSIQVGWAVHPLIYGDNRTRATAYWTADGSQKTGCYNTICPGFVQVHPQYHLGQAYWATSVIGGEQYITQLLVYLASKTITDDPRDNSFGVTNDDDNAIDQDEVVRKDQSYKRLKVEAEKCLVQSERFSSEKDDEDDVNLPWLERFLSLRKEYSPVCLNWLLEKNGVEGAPTVVVGEMSSLNISLVKREKSKQDGKG